MSTFLQLCQAVAQQSGTISSTGLPSTVAAQSGRLKKVVDWTAEAYRQIQNDRDGWRWMRKEWEGVLNPGTPRYSAASFNLDRFAAWVGDNGAYRPTTLYDPDRGPSDEGAIREIGYELYRTRYGRGQQRMNKPSEWAVSPDDEICFGTYPDKAYPVFGEYRRSAQTLSADGDVPEMPERFHDLIIYRGLILLSDHDEAGIARQTAVAKAAELQSKLERSQLPEVYVGSEPLA